MAGYMTGWLLALPFAMLTVIPKMIVRHIQSAHENAAISYTHNVEACFIVAEMADGSWRYVEDPFPIGID